LGISTSFDAPADAANHVHSHMHVQAFVPVHIYIFRAEDGTRRTGIILREHVPQQEQQEQGPGSIACPLLPLCTHAVVDAESRGGMGRSARSTNRASFRRQCGGRGRLQQQQQQQQEQEQHEKEGQGQEERNRLVGEWGT